MRATFRTALLAASLLLTSCSDDPVSTSGSSRSSYVDASLELYTSGIGSIGGRSAQDFYASGTIIGHYDGRSWELVEWPNAADTYGTFDAIWADHDNAIQCQQYRRLFRYDGESWTSVDLPINSKYQTVTPCEDGTTFVIDEQEHVYRLASTTWSEVDSLTLLGRDFFELGGTSADDLLAMGRRGEVAHFDGDSWTLTRPGETRFYNSAWKDPSGPLYMVGSWDSLFALNGTSMEYVDLGNDFRAEYVYGNAPGQVFVQGRWSGQSCTALRKREGNSWPLVECSQSGLSTWTAPTGESFIGSDNRLTRVDGEDRDVVLGETSDFRQQDYFSDIWGNETDGYFAVGYRAFRYFNGEWTDLNKQELTVNHATSVWGTGAHDIWAVGDAMILHYDGKDWTWVNGANQKRMLSVWCNDRDAFAVGYDGTIIHKSGNDGWEAMESGTTYRLSAVWGWDTGAFAAGESGVILRYDGRRWRIESSPITWYIYDLFGLARDDIWAVGASAVEICHYDGRTWTPVDITPPMLGSCVSVWASSDRNVFVAHSSGRLLHYDGDEWAVSPRYFTDAACVWGVPAGDVILGGAGIIRYRR